MFRYKCSKLRTLRRLLCQNTHFAFDKSKTYCYFPENSFYWALAILYIKLFMKIVGNKNNETNRNVSSKQENISI